MVARLGAVPPGVIDLQQVNGQAREQLADAFNEAEGVRRTQSRQNQNPVMT